MNTRTLLQQFFAPALAAVPKRFKSELEVKWVQPERVRAAAPQKTGDVSPYMDPDLLRPKKIYQDVVETDEYKQTSEEVKKLMSVGYSAHWQAARLVKHDLMDSVRRHPCDQGSVEATIAALTSSIRYYQRLVLDENHKHWSRGVRAERKDLLYKLVAKRKSFLNHLRKVDYKRFEWILEKLDLEYHPNPTDTRNIFRKPAIRKVTSDYCEKVRNDKLEAYKKELERLQVDFEKEKADTLEFIERVEKELSLQHSVEQ